MKTKKSDKQEDNYGSLYSVDIIKINYTERMGECLRGNTAACKCISSGMYTEERVIPGNKRDVSC